MPLDFRKLVCSRFLYVLAMQMQVVVLGWQMYILTNSAFYLGLIGLAEALPALGFALYAGYFVDHKKPLPVYFFVLCICITSASLLLVGQSEAVNLSLNIKITALYISSVLTGIARSFAHPSIYAIVPRLVSREMLPKAAAVSSSTMQIARIAGPAIGGILFGFIGIIYTTSLIVSLLLFGLLIAFQIKKSPAASQEFKSESSFKVQILAGAIYVLRHPVLFPALTLDMVSVFLGGVIALLPIYASEILNAGPQGLGLLRGSPAIGAAIMSLILIFIPIKQHAGKLLYIAVAGFGFSIIIFALSTDLTLSMLALAISGSFDSISVVIRSSAIQLCSPEALRGRISSVNSMFIGSSNELGEFESGMTAGLFGVVNAALFGGLACLATVSFMIFYFPTLRKLDLSKLTVEEIL